MNAQTSFGQTYPHAVTPGRTLLAEYGLSPEQLLATDLGPCTTFSVDFGQLWQRPLVMWQPCCWIGRCEQHLDPAAIKHKLRFVGITRRAQTSPKTWRWQQHVGMDKAVLTKADQECLDTIDAVAVFGQ